MAQTLQDHDDDTFNHTHNHRLVYFSAANQLRLATFLTIIILAVEVVGAILSHSLALLSDAGHVLTDVAALGLAWFAAKQAQKPSNDRWTFGYHRIGIVSAFINGISLVLIVGYIAYEAVRRLASPEHVQPGIMIISALVGVGVNLLIITRFARHQHSLNVRAALLHAAGDVGASLAVVIGAIAIALSGAIWVDPVISLLIAAIIAMSALRIIRETMRIMLETTPADIPLTELVGHMKNVNGVQDVHDLHVWTIADGVRALSCHALIADVPPSSSQAILDALNTFLADTYHINHTTIQFECVTCPTSSLYCEISEDHSKHHANENHMVNHFPSPRSEEEIRG